MPSRGQSIVLTYVAWDTNANVGKSGDVANHTLRWIKDGTSSAPTNSASEIDATNAPGAYKLTLTTAECTCDTGTLVGKSSTANVSIVPVSIAFEQLPTVAAGATNGLPLVDSSGRVKSNLEAIDGLATTGNNATLNLKKLSIVNGDFGGIGLEISTTLAGGSGGAVKISGTGGGNYGLSILGNYGLGITSTAVGADAIALTGGFSGYGLKGSISGNITGNLSGSVGSISTVRPKKNTGLDNFMFPMFDSTTKNPKIGLTVTAERAIDGNPFSPCSNAAVELSNGVYRVNLSASDLNGNKIMLRFSSPGADDQLVEIITQD